MWCLTYFSEVVQEAASIAQGSCAPLLVPGFMSSWFIRAIVFSISAILNFRVSASVSADVLDYISFLRVVLNYWVRNDVACFTCYLLVWLVAVEATTDTSPGRYTSPPVQKASSLRSVISSFAGFRARDAPPSSEASSSSTAPWVSTAAMEGYLAGDRLKPG